MTAYFDAELLRKQIKAQRGEQGLREAADAMQNISFSTLHRIEHGSIPSIEDLLEIANWLGGFTWHFLQAYGGDSRPGSDHAIRSGAPP